MLTVAKDGVDQQWAIEMGGPAGRAWQGWRPKTLRSDATISALKCRRLCAGSDRRSHPVLSRSVR
jgi:hypothetical protein